MIKKVFALLALVFSAPVAAQECPAAVVLYYSPYCGYSQRVLEAMEEMDVHMPKKDVNSDKEAKEELRVKGGRLQVPCLLIDGQPLYGDLEIIEWIKDHRECLK